MRKYPLSSNVVNMWNSLPNDMVVADTINTSKNRLDKYWSNQDVLFNFNADLIGTGSHINLYVKVMLRCGQRGLPAPVRTHWIALDTETYNLACRHINQLCLKNRNVRHPDLYLSQLSVTAHELLVDISVVFVDC